MERFSKVSGLSETGVSAIQYDAVSKKLFVAYNNSNVDVLDAKAFATFPTLNAPPSAAIKIFMPFILMAAAVICQLVSA